VAPDLLVEVAPMELVLAMGVPGTLVATIKDPATGDVLEDFDLSWRITDGRVATVTPSTDTRMANVTPNGLGIATAVVCVDGLDDLSCGQADVRVVYNVGGTWSYNESLTVDVDPPARETCTVQGTMTILQDGDLYVGTAHETVTCTWYPGDGSDPTTVTISATGQIRSGLITEDHFTHEGFFTAAGANDEACRTTGTLTGSGGIANTTSGTVECLDEMDFYSTGPSHGTRISGFQVSPGISLQGTRASQRPYPPAKRTPASRRRSLGSQLLW
jgi:hypothetical protein